MWLQRLLVQSLASLTAPPRNVPSLWVIFGQAWWQLGTDGQEQSSEKLGQDAASKTCPPPVLKPSLCVIKCFYSSRETFLRAFLCQILCGADVVRTQKGQPWKFTARQADPTWAELHSQQLIPGDAGAAQPLCSAGADQSSREGGPGRVHVVDLLCIKCCGWVEDIKWRKPTV